MTPTDSAWAYAKGVLDGDIIAGKYAKLACQRFWDDLIRASTTDWRYYFNPDAANKAVRFMEKLRHVRGAMSGKRFKMEPWQHFIECNLFGWLDKDTELRRFRTTYEEIPRKNGKSIRVAARGMYIFCNENKTDRGMECISGAGTEKQAWHVFWNIREWARTTPEIKDRFGIEVNAKSLIIMETGSKFEPVVGNLGDGGNYTFAAIDEYHEHPDDVLYDCIQTGQGARSQPMLSAITTAGSNLSGPCYEHREDVIRVLEGTVEDDTLFGIIFTIDEGDRWDCEEALIKANPNYDVSISAEYLQQELNKARRSASKQNAFRTKHLNEWLGAKTAYMNMVAWQRQKKVMSIEDFKGESCHVAVDLAEQIDASSVVAMFKRDGQYYVFAEHFVPEAAFERNPRYKNFHLGGHINVTDGNAQDYDVIRKHIDWLADNFTILAIQFDPWQANQMMQSLLETGLTVYKFAQGFSFYSDPMKTIETLVLDGDLFHSGDPVLTWMVGNTAAKINEDQHMRPVKGNPNSPICKIDGCVAMIMAMKGYQDTDEPQSYLETSGVVGVK